MLNKSSRIMGFIIGFSTIILVVSSNLIIYNGNYLSAYRLVEVSSDVDDFENRYFSSNPLEELNRLCQNKPDDLICNRLENDDDESKGDHSDDTSDKRNEQREKLGQLLEEDKIKEQQWQQEQEEDEEDKHESKITSLKIQNMRDSLEKKLDLLKDRTENKKDNQRLVDQREESKEKGPDTANEVDKTEEPSHDTYKGYGLDATNDKSKGNDDNDDKSFNFAAAGDFGCSTNAQNTVESIVQREPELVLPLGDLSYHSSADCWFDITSPLKGKMMVTLGYHDTQDGAAKMNQYINSFQLDKPYYSYDYKKVHFLIMASQSDYNEGSDQYNFVVQDLEKASQNKDIEWTVVTSYGPFYTSPSTHKAEKDLRDIYHPIFEKYNVDLVLQAHNHNYQRTYPISYNSAGDSSEPILTNQNTTGYYNGTDGTVFALVGTGGESFYPFSGQAPYVAKQFDGRFGFLDISISNGNPHPKLTGTFYDNKGGNALDQFSIEKEIKNTEADIQPVSLSTSNVSPASQNSNPNRDYLPSCNYCDK
ncbi:MAG: metallophosphoesterase [Nitrososphaeraceae archaeon]|nr:metallophosphoesterase [Nitrososphaeraceae archaeon]